MYTPLEKLYWVSMYIHGPHVDGILRAIATKAQHTYVSMYVHVR